MGEPMIPPCGFESLRALMDHLTAGGPAIVAIFTLSVLAVGISGWKIWRFLLMGVWRSVPTAALESWASGNANEALELSSRRNSLRYRFAHTTMQLVRTGDLREEDAREETLADARDILQNAASGLRALELIATIAPLVGLLGTVLGMIAAFQALQESGNQADPSVLAGGIWEALLTTAAGMAVAIPSMAALTWFEGTVERLRHDLERMGIRIHSRQRSSLEQVA